MYWLFRLKGYKPSEVYNIPPGELLILRAFIRQEIEDTNKQYDTEGGL